MLVFDAFNHLVTGFSEVRRRSATVRIVDQLPRELRDDIGWPLGRRVHHQHTPEYWG